MNCRFIRPSVSTVFAASLLAVVAGHRCVAQHVTQPSAASNYVGAAEPITQAEIYGQGVRETDWKTPAAEKAGFHLPPGFEVELFADEQLINKPLNMAWDTRGRLWVTSTLEYPYPAKPDAVPRDSIRILEDTDGDMRADKVTVFADQLNIPMGLLPVKDGVICFSIPHIWHLKDVDGDDRVDERIQLLGPFDTTRDTHGMVSSLTRSADGWIYACHGFNNQSLVTAKDGSKVQLNSGNTFRFRDDGSSIQQYTQGQVNPFGLTRDEWGNWYSADCHSKPLTALLQNACYPSFGRPDDGLGFAPDMMQHLHGSTAICGLTYYQASHFPAAYRHLFYSGNVMTSRINCNAPRWNGATVAAIEQPDFMTSDDPWFRPVDIQLGPDGALYVADFYNKIIGHYEVPLEHPERDRDSGRIWRITYHGDGEHAPAASLASATHFAQPAGNVSDVVKALDDDNLTRRRLAIETALASQMMLAAELEQDVLSGQQPLRLRMSALELLHRRKELKPEVLLKLIVASRSDAAADSKQKEQLSAPELTVLALRLAEWAPAGEELQAVMTAARAQLQSDRTHPQVAKAIVELLGRRGSAEDVSLLLTVATRSADHDPALHHISRIAVRELLRDADNLRVACAAWLSDAANVEERRQPGQVRLLAHILPGVDSPLAAQAMLGYVARYGESDKRLVEQAIQAASRYATPEMIARLLKTLATFESGNAVAMATRFHQLCDSYRAKQGQLSAELIQFGNGLQAELLSQLAGRLADSGTRVTWMDKSGKDWAFQARGCADGHETQLISSHTLGEQYTGILTSEAIKCPAHLSFWLAGHDGVPDNPPQRLNLVRLVNPATSQVIHVAYPPRNDQAQLVQWDLSSWVGEPVRVEVVDGDAGDAYAWLAVGRFSESQLERGNIDEIIPAIAASLRQGFKATNAVETIESLPLSPRQRAGLVVAALQGTGLQPTATLAQQAMQLGRVDLLTAELLNSVSDDRLLELTVELCATATASQQTGLAKALLSTSSGCGLLNKLLDRGVVSLFALQGIDSLLPSGLNAELKSQLEGHLAAAASLPAPTVDVAARLASLTDNSAWTNATVEKGQQLYTQHCAVCHQLRGTGNLVGPQLDGAVVRGRDRLAEDILDPNRNVDRAFRLSALLMEDDSVVTGLVQESEDGRTVIVTSQDGKKMEYPADAIADRRDSTQSLMPSNFGEVLTDEQLAALLMFLK